MATAGEAAKHLGLSERRVKELVDQGIIARAERGKYDLDIVRQSYIEHLREAAAGRAPTGPLDPTQERARKDAALADKTEMENDLRRGQVVEIADVVREVAQHYAEVRSLILAMPSKVAPRVAVLKTPEECRAVIYDAVCDALETLSTDKGDAANG